MNATVITTGPGVIIETATASMNCRSVSQWYWLTTPPYRNGTIASPLPNTKAPAFKKNRVSVQTTLPEAAPCTPVDIQPNPIAARVDRFRKNAGGCLTRIDTTPQRM